MNWMQQFRKRIDQKEQPESTPKPKATCIDYQKVSEQNSKTELIPIKDLTRDELVFCIREMESELGKLPAAIDEYWSVEKLQKWLENLELLSSKSVSDSVTYQLIKNPCELKSALERLGNVDVLAIDTETTGLDPRTDRIRTIQLAVDKQPVLILDLFKFKNHDLTSLKELLSGNAIKVFHNAKFDLKFLRMAGLGEVGGQIFDTMLAAQLLTAGLNNQKHTLQALAEDYLFETISKEEQTSNWEDELTEDQLTYAAKDAKILLLLRLALKKVLVEASLVDVAKLEFDCLLAVVEMELSGMRLDLEKWSAYGQMISDRLESCRQILREYFGDETNLNSTRQLQNALAGLGISVTSTARSVLAKYIGKHPAIDALLEYKKLSRLKSSIEALPTHIHSVTGRLHANYWQVGSKAGRFSCSNPNLQQVPRSAEVRECFIPDVGNKLVIADYSQIELRVVAEISGDSTMIEAYRTGRDLHRLTASLVKGGGIEEVTKEERQAAKAVNFGLIFGMGANGLKNSAKNNYGVAASNGFCVRVGCVGRFLLERHGASMASSLKRFPYHPKEKRCRILSGYTRASACPSVKPSIPRY